MSNEGCLTESGEPELGRPLRDHWVLQHMKRPKSGDVGWESIATQIEDNFPCPEDHTASHVFPQKTPASCSTGEMNRQVVGRRGSLRYS